MNVSHLGNHNTSNTMTNIIEILQYYEMEVNCGTNANKSIELINSLIKAFVRKI
jgi:hypothetical protein